MNINNFNETNSKTTTSYFGKLSAKLKGVHSVINESERRKFLISDAPFSTNSSIVSTLLRAAEIKEKGKFFLNLNFLYRKIRKNKK